jgi:hypothetical protein
MLSLAVQAGDQLLHAAQNSILSYVQGAPISPESMGGMMQASMRLIMYVNKRYVI